jgi:hypothetical protein
VGPEGAERCGEDEEGADRCGGRGGPESRGRTMGVESCGRRRPSGRVFQLSHEGSFLHPFILLIIEVEACIKI